MQSRGEYDVVDQINSLEILTVATELLRMDAGVHRPADASWDKGDPFRSLNNGNF